MGLFEILDEAAANGNDVHITWVHKEDDDNMEEMGEEFGDDLENAKFEFKRLSSNLLETTFDVWPLNSLTQVVQFL